MLHILNNLSLVQVTGKDALKFLNNHFTCNILKLKKNMFKITSHCNVQGKVISTMYVLYHQNNVIYIQNQTISQYQIKILKKYSIFYDVKILEDTSVVLLELSELKSKLILKSIFHIIPNKFNTVIHNENYTMIYFDYPKPRYLLIVNISIKNDIIFNLKKSFFTSTYQNWILWNIKSQFPIIEHKTSELFFPQEINMLKLKGIDFNKGCYIGQEIISRIEYLKIKKKFLATIYGISYKYPMVGDIIECNLNQWVRSGIILSIYRVDMFYFLIQAVLKMNIYKSTRKRFRLQKDHRSNFFLVFPLKKIVNQII
ncbi:MAG: tRNA-modifying protein YgfZ [Wigglesworthia glossinidia]|nr:tRNA-modifying protein YgfZ [Wigglesworthia glossinidia]